MTTTTKIIIILFFIFLVAPLIIYLIVWYLKKKTLEAAKYGAGMVGMAGELIKDEVQNIVATPFRPDDLENEEEVKVWNETFSTEAVKNLINPSEWLKNISYWWS